MSAFSDYSESKVGNHLLRGVSSTAPTAVYLSLFESDPTDTGAAGTEASYAGYAPIITDATIADGFTEDSNGVFSNANELIFADIVGATITVSHWVLRDHPTAGNVLYRGAFDESKDYAAGEAPRVKVGEVVITHD